MIIMHASFDIVVICYIGYGWPIVASDDHEQYNTYNICNIEPPNLPTSDYFIVGYCWLSLIYWFKFHLYEP